MDGTHVGVGQIIAYAIESSAQAYPDMLGFPILITQLCLRRYVPIGREPRMKTIQGMTVWYIGGVEE